jgi:uncharacterized protein (DUF2147 family)
MYRTLLLSLTIALAAPSLTRATTNLSPVGLWRTMQDQAGAPGGLIRIYRQDDRYFGRIEQTSPGDTRTCSRCTDERKDKPFVGLVIIRNLVAVGDGYEDGDILDPESGRSYHCTLHLENGGRSLIVRGYVGLSLLGRSVVWHRE